MAKIMAEDQMQIAVAIADTFLKSGRMLYDDDKTLSTIIPCAVNTAFACELYIKVIQNFELGQYNNHEHIISNLFLELDDTKRSSIESKFLSKVTLSNNITEYTTLLDFLEKEGNNFVEWRYAFEGLATTPLSSNDTDQSCEINLNSFSITLWFAFAETLKEELSDCI